MGKQTSAAMTTVSASKAADISCGVELVRRIAAILPRLMR